MNINAFGHHARVAPGSGRKGEGGVFSVARSLPLVASLAVLPRSTVIHFLPDGKTRSLCGCDMTLATDVDVCASSSLCRNCVTYLERRS